jgi:hypothetical protein
VVRHAPHDERAHRQHARHHPGDAGATNPRLANDTQAFQSFRARVRSLQPAARDASGDAAARRPASRGPAPWRAGSPDGDGPAVLPLLGACVSEQREQELGDQIAAQINAHVSWCGTPR